MHIKHCVRVGVYAECCENSKWIWTLIWSFQFSWTPLLRSFRQLLILQLQQVGTAKSSIWPLLESRCWGRWSFIMTHWQCLHTVAMFSYSEVKVVLRESSLTLKCMHVRLYNYRRREREVFLMYGLTLACTHMNTFKLRNVEY